jgi:hypothetical protein
MHRSTITAATAGAGLLLLLTTQVSAVETSLYDGELNSDPLALGWLTYADNVPAQDFYTFGGGQTQLNTLNLGPTATGAIQAGFSNYTPAGTLVNPSFPTLDRTAGFVVSFVVKVNSEVHDSTDRAGFSVTVLGSDAKGIELGFWNDRVFAQNGGTAPTLFTQGESGLLNTTGDYLSYSLSVNATGYELSQFGIPVVSGPIRDYSAFVPPLPVPDPYELPNYIFLGDNTTSARADISWAGFSVDAVPEPASAMLAMICATGLLVARRRR